MDSRRGKKRGRALTFCRKGRRRGSLLIQYSVEARGKEKRKKGEKLSVLHYVFLTEGKRRSESSPTWKM